MTHPSSVAENMTLGRRRVHSNEGSPMDVRLDNGTEDDEGRTAVSGRRRSSSDSAAAAGIEKASARADEGDVDADGEAEADAEVDHVADTDAELHEAVDAAEANTESMKEEDG
jgi:hypothetical protein